MIRDDEDIALYKEAAQAFPEDKHRTDKRSGVTITYLDGESITTKLNQVFGIFGWSFEILADGEYEGERWCRGRLTVYKRQQLSRLDPTTNTEVVTEVIHAVMREQYGSEKIKRSRTSGAVLDIGFNMKGAATDCLKKCASLFGIGLYLWNKDEGALERALAAREQEEDEAEQEKPQRLAQGRSGARQAASEHGPVINGVQMPKGFRPPFVLDLKSELPADACRAKGCPEDVPDDSTYVVNGHDVTGEYVKERSDQELATVLCPGHLTQWVSERKRAQGQEAAA